MKKIFDLRDLMLEQLRDLYHGEAHVLKELYDVPEKITDESLRNLVRQYVVMHEDQILRLRQVFELQFEQKRGEFARPIRAMVEDIHDLVRRCEDTEVLDASLIVALQHIIHYKIAGYGAVCTYAKQLGFLDEAVILHTNLEEEKKYDRKLAMVADATINRKAISPQV